VVDEGALAGHVALAGVGEVPVEQFGGDQPEYRVPEEFEAAARPDTRAAVEAFTATSLAKKTAPEALAATKATTVGEL